MTAADHVTSAERPATCQARLEAEYPTCERCGLAWHKADHPPPPCNPMTVMRLRAALLGEAAALEGSHHLVVQMQDAGMPADPRDALRRATALRAVLRFVDRCTGNREIVDILKRIARADARAAEQEAGGHEGSGA